MLGVSHLQLTRYMLERTTISEPHIFVLATEIQPVVSLRFISTVTRWFDPSEPDGQLTTSEQLAFESFVAKREFKAALGGSTGYYWPHPSSKRRIQDVIIRSTKALVDDLVENTDHADNVRARHSTNAADLTDKLSRSFTKGSELYHAALEQEAITAQQMACKSFHVHAQIT